MMVQAIATQAILVVGIGPSDGVCLDSIFLGSVWRPHPVDTCGQALDFLHRHRVSVVLSERDLSDGSWRQLLNGMADRRLAPKFIVSSRLADHRLWADVLSLGGFDVLMTPFDAKEVLWVTSSAHDEWGRKQPQAPLRAASAGSTRV